MSISNNPPLNNPLPNSSVSPPTTRSEDIVDSLGNRSLSVRIKHLPNIIIWIIGIIVNCALGYYFYASTRDKLKDLDDFRANIETRLNSQVSTINELTGEVSSFRTMLTNIFQPHTEEKNDKKK